MDRIPDDVLDRPIDGLNLRGSTLRTELSGGPAVIAFLRHLG